MALKFIITSEDELPTEETLKGLYSKEGDKWILGVEGAVPKQQLNEFREKNIELKKALEGLGETKPEDAIKAIRRVAELETQLGKDKDKFDELLAARTGEMKTEYEKQLAAREAALGETRGQLKTLKIDQAIEHAGGEFGLRQGAGPDLVARGRAIFDLDEDGNIISKDPDGNQRYNKTGEPLAPKDWVQSMVKEASHLFDESQGSGAAGSGSRGSGGGANPWAKDTWNLTEQGRIMQADPSRAQRLAAQAGKKI